VLLHGHPDFAITDRASDQPHAVVVEGPLEAEVTHHGGDHAPAGKVAVILELVGPCEEDVVAIENRSFFVHQQHSIGISVEGEAAIRAILEDHLCEHLRSGCAAVGVDVVTVRLRRDGGDACSKTLEKVSRKA
jgi:hypothetical protein